MSARLDVSTPGEYVTQILVDAGERNFLTWQLAELLEAELVRARDGGCRVIVVGSALEEIFIAHGDLDDIVETFGGGSAAGDPTAMIRVQRELDTGPMVSIAAVDGQAWGGGAELAWACDLRVASTGATFGQPEVMVGTTPAGGAARIARLAGEAAAKRLVLEGRPVPAEEARRLGLVHRVVPRGEALAAAVEWATWLAGRPPGALAACKAAVTAAREGALRTVLRTETEMFIERVSRPETLDRVREVKSRYDGGADSWDAFGIPREPLPGE